MKKKLYLIIGFCLILLFAIRPIWHYSEHFIDQTKTVKQSKKKPQIKKHIITWGYPFSRLYQKQIKFKSGQKYGKTDILRRLYPTKSYFHDGYDYGFSEVGHSPVLAVHAGTVKKVHYRAGMGLYIWVISDDGYVEVYQEGFLSITDIYVKKGQKVKLGQEIGKLTGSHIHLGITKTYKDYIDKYGDPCKNWWKNNGTWLDPMKIIETDLRVKK